MSNAAMIYKGIYDSKLGRILIECDEYGITGLGFLQKETSIKKSLYVSESASPAIIETKLWLDSYFNSGQPHFTPMLHPYGTDFQKQVWDILLKIPYGKTVTYGDIAKEIAEVRKIPRMSAQAVGTAVGKNPVAIIIPCHRVVGATGIGGFEYGLDIKRGLLETEGIFGY